MVSSKNFTSENVVSETGHLISGFGPAWQQPLRGGGAKPVGLALTGAGQPEDQGDHRGVQRRHTASESSAQQPTGRESRAALPGRNLHARAAPSARQSLRQQQLQSHLHRQVRPLINDMHAEITHTIDKLNPVDVSEASQIVRFMWMSNSSIQFLRDRIFFVNSELSYLVEILIHTIFERADRGS